MRDILRDPTEASIWEEAWESYKTSDKAFGPGLKKPGYALAWPTHQFALSSSCAHASCATHCDLQHCSTMHVPQHKQMVLLLHSAVAPLESAVSC